MTDTLQQLRELGNSRRNRWHTPDTEPWSGADWSNAMCGEAGEAANVVKKIRRIETGTGNDLPGTREHAMLIKDLAWELADTIAYADLLAQHYGIDLRAAIAEKFNHVSERERFPERMSVATEDDLDPRREIVRRARMAEGNWALGDAASVVVANTLWGLAHDVECGCEDSTVDHLNAYRADRLTEES